jgi:transcription antitermination factor NusG
MTQNWYVVYTKSNAEKKVAMHLAKKGYEAFCPLNCILNHYQDKKKLVFEPMFKNYVFVKTTPNKLKEITKISDDIINLVYWLDEAATIKESEVNDIKDFLNEFKNVRLEKRPVNQTTLMHIAELVNVNKTNTQLNTNTIKLSIPSLGFNLIADLAEVPAIMLSSTSVSFNKLMPSF